MFDYLKKMKDKEFQVQEAEPCRKPKRDKVFIGILIAFACAAVFSVVTGMSGIREEVAGSAGNGFHIGITDGMILGGAVVGYLILRWRKGR